ncbi:hypothetical protein ACGF7U_31495 [Micromonospora sp. NPDC047670]|uniref:hypothetical protein n=1 Tax=Micromonospora sp. NPDC047670 TaxID=3364252 RepID=UPI003711D7A9
MTSMYDEASPSMVAAIASTIIDRHDGGGTCAGCTPDGCEALGWARTALAEHRAARAARLARRPLATGV